MGDNPMVSTPNPIENNPNAINNIPLNTEAPQEVLEENIVPEITPVVENQEPSPKAPLERIDKDIENLRGGRELNQLTEGEKALLAELMREKNILLDTQTEGFVPQSQPEQVMPIPETVIPQQEENKVETPPTVTNINTNTSNYNPEVQGFVEKLTTTSTGGSL